MANAQGSIFGSQGPSGEAIETAPNGAGVFEPVGTSTGGVGGARDIEGAGDVAPETVGGAVEEPITTLAVRPTGPLAVRPIGPLAVTETAVAAEAAPPLLTTPAAPLLLEDAAPVAGGFGVAVGIGAGIGALVAGGIAAYDFHKKHEQEKEGMAIFDVSEPEKKLSKAIQLGSYKNVVGAVFHMAERDGDQDVKSMLGDFKAHHNKLSEVILSDQQVSTLKQHLQTSIDKLRPVVAKEAKENHILGTTLGDDAITLHMLESAQKELKTYGDILGQNHAKLVSGGILPTSEANKVADATKNAPVVAQPVAAEQPKITGDAPKTDAPNTDGTAKDGDTKDGQAPADAIDFQQLTASAKDLLDRDKSGRDDVVAYANLVQILKGGDEGKAEAARITSTYNVNTTFFDSKAAVKLLKDLKKDAADPDKRQALLDELYDMEKNGALKEHGDSHTTKKERASALKGLEDIKAPPTAIANPQPAAAGAGPNGP